MEKIYRRVLGKQEVNFDQFREDNNIYSPIEIDFLKQDLGINRNDLFLIREISKHAQLIVTNNVADVSFLDESYPKYAIENLYKVNTYSVLILYGLIKEYCVNNPLFVHTGTFFAGEGNNLYEDSKKKASSFLEKQNGNILELCPPIICGQSEDGPNPYSTINIDVPFVAMKTFYDSIKLNITDGLVMNVDGEYSMNMVTVDKLASLMLEFIIKRSSISRTSFESISLIGKSGVSPQETVFALIDIYNKLHNTSYPSDYIGIGSETRGLDEKQTQIAEKLFAYARRNSRRKVCDKLFSHIGVDYQIFYNQLYYLAIRNFRPKGKVVHVNRDQ
ncbi:MAG: hypothetical protein D3905_16320 [Candidatus Electrothrix sp. AS4_5]|nr:hypothetical protein [Candidatus Electrothrix gigas]